MKTFHRIVITILSLSFLFFVPAFQPQADDQYSDSQKNRSNHKKKERYKGKWPSPVNNSTYNDQCGNCHFAYQPGLLPKASWEKIMNDIESHFGESVELDEKIKKEIISYLTTNSADNSSNKLSMEIMRSINGAIPDRITDIPCIRHEHHEISSSVYKRKSIGSMSNCAACHQSAAEGNYDDDRVSIPKQ